jgi:regulator of CtrA degradation
MPDTSNLSRPIIEALYSEALLLADEVRAVFALGARDPIEGDDTMVRLALSTEGLKTTTRMMHILAWLLNQRAYFSGELSASQVRRHGALPPDCPSDPKQLDLLEEPTCELIAETEQMHHRIARLDAAWRRNLEKDSPVRAIHDRIGKEFGV